MGRDISKTQFTEDDFACFKQKLLEEYRILADWFQAGALKK